MPADPTRIPNLVEGLRAARAARGGARGSRRPEPREAPRAVDKDAIVQQTDSDAAGSRLSAVELGYLEDPFAPALAATPASVRRMPIINRGTYVRTTAIDKLVDEFLDEHKGEAAQVISLGAGTDTRPFRLLRRRKSLMHTLRYHEIDFPATTAKKVAAIQRSSELSQLISFTTEGDQGNTQSEVRVSENGTSIQSDCYSLHALDLRELAGSTPPQPKHLSFDTPTLIISECCLTYLSSDASNAILRHLINQIGPSAPCSVILYEPIGPTDSFGRTMISNLASRHIEMPGLLAFPGLAQHEQRLRDCGFTSRQESFTIRKIWATWVDSVEKERLRHCEMIDEEEEWNLLAEHYAIITACRDAA